MPIKLEPNERRAWDAARAHAGLVDAPALLTDDDIDAAIRGLLGDLTRLWLKVAEARRAAAAAPGDGPDAPLQLPGGRGSKCRTIRARLRSKLGIVAAGDERPTRAEVARLTADELQRTHGIRPSDVEHVRADLARAGLKLRGDP